MKTVNVKFQSSDKLYAYKCYDNSVEADDFAVVVTQYGVKVVKVISVDDEINEMATSSIVQLIDFTSYDKRVKDEKRKAELLKLMNERKNEIARMATYQHMSSFDDTMKDLLDEYYSISN